MRAFFGYYQVPTFKAAHVAAVIELSLAVSCHDFKMREDGESELWRMLQARPSARRQAAGNALAATATRTKHGSTRLVPNHDV